MNTTKLLVTVVVLQAMILLGQWTGSGPVTPAYGQIPDAGAQRSQMVDELRALNGKMDRLIGLLEGGKVQVSLPKPDERKKAE